ncbi:hypothetical protein, partial [Cetobacterium sp.]|uniref:hypothetical protein n=1 Tax=Cetobacterium sp. TaxID=2071632 RepID=UPI003EE6F6CB
MPTFTKHLNLRKPSENDFYNQETEQCENWDKLDEWSEGIDNKTKGATSEVAGIVKYGTDVSTALEGSKLAEILGIEYGGVLNNNNQKAAGKGYYDTANKKIYKCTTNTSINYADAGYFIEVSNNDLLGKLQNLGIRNNIEIVASTNIPNGVLQIIRTRMGNIAYFTAMATTNNS